MGEITLEARSSISKNRDRECVIRHLLSKIFSTLRERGHPDLDYLAIAVHLPEDVTIATCESDSCVTLLSVYWLIHGRIVKVFSAHILRGADMRGDPNFYRYGNGRVRVINWRRGRWEDMIVADAATALPSEMFFSEGSQSERRWLQWLNGPIRRMGVMECSSRR